MNTILPEAASGKDIRLLSHEVQEIISRRPNWIVRNGILLFLIIICLLLTISFFISYPDIITTNARLTSINAPRPVIAKTAGMLVKLCIKEGQSVRQNEVLGFMESSAAHEEVMALSDRIDSLQQLAAQHAEALTMPGYMSYTNLGELQPSFQVFMQAWSVFRQYLSAGFYVKKKKMLLDDMAFLQRLHGNLQEQKQIQQQDLNLSRQTFEANTSLSRDRVIAVTEYRAEESKYLAKTMSIPLANAALLHNESSRRDKEKELAQLENDIVRQKDIFIQALNTLKAQLDDWKSRYLLLAPVAGRVAFAAIIQDNTRISQEQTICYIDPGNTSYYATIFIPQANFGKVSPGKKVLLKLTAYPYQEFGTLKGSLDFIATIPSDSGFMAKVILPEGLRTNYRKQLYYKEGFTAQAEIITEDLKLSDRLFNELRSVIKKN